MAGKEGLLSQKKVLDNKRKVATTVFIHGATGMSHSRILGKVRFPLVYVTCIFTK